MFLTFVRRRRRRRQSPLSVRPSRRPSRRRRPSSVRPSRRPSKYYLQDVAEASQYIHKHINDINESKK